MKPVLLMIHQLIVKLNPFQLKFKTSILTGLSLVAMAGVTACSTDPVNSVNSKAGLKRGINQNYVVRTGDTLSAIATRYGTTYVELARLNNIQPPYNIQIGQKLRLPARTQPNQSVIQNRALSNTPLKNGQPPSTQPIAQPRQPINTGSPTTPSLPTTAGRWVLPSNGQIIQAFDLSKNVKGLRFGGRIGDPVFAAAEGQVVYADDGLPEYGKLILVQHASGYVTAYAHNNRMLVKEMDLVRPGQQIAEMGSTGTNTTMLEFQIRQQGKPINPAQLLGLN